MDHGLKQWHKKISIFKPCSDWKKSINLFIAVFTCNNCHNPISIICFQVISTVILLFGGVFLVLFFDRCICSGAFTNFYIGSRIMALSGIIVLKNYFNTDQLYIPKDKCTSQFLQKVVRRIKFKKE